MNTDSTLHAQIKGLLLFDWCNFGSRLPVTHAGQRLAARFPIPLGHADLIARLAGGLVISTEYEPHKGAFPGTHGRYRLETPLVVLTEARS